MELFVELLLTVSLSLIFTSLLIKLMSSIQPISTDIDRLTKEALKFDKFQWMPLKEEVIELEECPSEGKSSVELYNVVGVNKEDIFQIVYGANDDHGDDDKGTSFRSEEENGGDRKFSDIEIESVEEIEEEKEIEQVGNGIMDDWEEIGRKDFEELLGNKEGAYEK